MSFRKVRIVCKRGAPNIMESKLAIENPNIHKFKANARLLKVRLPCVGHKGINPYGYIQTLLTFLLYNVCVNYKIDRSLKST